LKITRLIAFILFVLHNLTAHTQTEVSGFFDLGKTNVSEGVYLKNAYGVQYELNSYQLSLFTRFDYLSNSNRFISAISPNIAKEIRVNNYPVNTKVYFMLNRFSEIMYGTDWGISFSKGRADIFHLELGVNFKTYAINKASRDKYDIDKSDSKISEDFTLIYDAGVFVKPVDHLWNAGFFITNTDHFLINQSTNPMFELKTWYNLTHDIKCFVDAWYKSAGIFNISNDKFGYFFRTGITWEL